MIIVTSIASTEHTLMYYSLEQVWTYISMKPHPSRRGNFFQTLLIAVASEYMSVSFHVILSRYLLKMTDKESSSRSKINTLIDENIALTSEAKAVRDFWKKYKSVKNL